MLNIILKLLEMVTILIYDTCSPVVRLVIFNECYHRYLALCFTLSVNQLVSYSVRVFLFFKTHKRRFWDHVGRWNFEWKLYVRLKNEDDPKNEDKLKNKDDLKNEDDLKNKNDLKNGDDLKSEHNLKNKEELKN